MKEEVVCPKCSRLVVAVGNFDEDIPVVCRNCGYAFNVKVLSNEETHHD